MLAWIVRLSLLAPAAALLWFGVAADQAWFERHVVLPALYPPPPSWTLTALRTAAAALGLLLAVCAALAGRRPTVGGVARVTLAVALALCASELGLRVLDLAVPATIEELLGAPDPRTGWVYPPRRSLDLAIHGGRAVRYAFDVHGDRAPSAEWIEDTQAPTVLVAGESLATGHGLPWEETFAARLARPLDVQVVNVATGGYSSGQAYLRTVDALARFAHPTAVVTTVLPVQVGRNLHDDCPHLVLREGVLTLAPAATSRLRIRQLLVNKLPYVSERDLQASLRLTRAVLQATAAAARARGARPLFVFAAFGPPAPSGARPDEFMVRELLDGLPHIVVDMDPAHAQPWDGHPDAEGARRIAAAIVEALGDGRP